MLAKLTIENQLTLPKSITASSGPAEHFDVEAREGQIILTPVRTQRGDRLRAKLVNWILVKPTSLRLPSGLAGGDEAAPSLMSDSPGLVPPVMLEVISRRRCSSQNLHAPQRGAEFAFDLCE